MFIIVEAFSAKLKREIQQDGSFSGDRVQTFHNISIIVFNMSHYVFFVYE